MSALVHDEIALAKAEIRQDVKRGAIGGGAITVAGSARALRAAGAELRGGVRDPQPGPRPGLVVPDRGRGVSAARGDPAALLAVAKFKKIKPPERSIASAKETAAVLQGVKPHTRPAQAKVSV